MTAWVICKHKMDLVQILIANTVRNICKKEGSEEDFFPTLLFFSCVKEAVYSLSFSSKNVIEI